ncbi:hypothetical protein AB0I28_24740 [Phytomonospora sp. NPDC050363]|uniref:hypothetical protein n=1 Tax=Phytomonospora sp. NPDC050363 TaxID=3155642 RepID=UPI0033C9D4F5
MKLVKLATEKVLDKLVGKVDAYAACPPDTYYRCVVNGICGSPGHERQRCWTKPDCSGITCASSGCC